MTKGKYSINWDDFSATAAERFGPLIREAKFSDVTLVSGDGQRISSHQVILATGCTFFKNLFEEEAASKMPLIFLRGVEASLILPLLDFLYTGKAEVDEELLADFVVLAEDLGVEGLTKSFDITQNETRLEDNEPEDSFDSIQKEAVLEESEKKNKKEATLGESEFKKADSPVSVDQTTSDALEVVKKETAKDMRIAVKDWITDKVQKKTSKAAKNRMEQSQIHLKRSSYQRGMNKAFTNVTIVKKRFATIATSGDIFRRNISCLF